MDDPEGFSDWAASNVPRVMRDDPIWRLPAYRFSLWLGDLAQLEDLPLIQRDDRTRKHADQFLDAVGSISANIAEGYGRTTGPDRAKFYEYALSSAREARDWYFKVRHALDPEVFDQRIDLITRVMKILTVAVVRERAEPETRARQAEREPRRPPRHSTHTAPSVQRPPAPSTSAQRPASATSNQQPHPATS